MRKSLIDVEAVAGHGTPDSPGAWLDLEEMAAVEVTSEDSLFPIDHALSQTPATGWRASATGPQIIRLNFDKPVTIRRIHLHFVERAVERSQEFAVYAKSGGELREVVRQQYSFSPGGSNEEIEDYTVELNEVTSLELRIDPDRAHDPTHSKHFAVLQSLRIA